MKVDKNTSDGYHTFAELYRYRMLYNAAFFNELYATGLITVGTNNHNLHKSWKHADGEPCFGKENYFVVVAELPDGQISNHYKGEHWDLFQIPERDKAALYDGHTPEQAAQRLESFINGQNSQRKQ